MALAMRDAEHRRDNWETRANLNWTADENANVARTAIIPNVLTH
jgi:hypothetical protein